MEDDLARHAEEDTVRIAEETRRRLLDAATLEFASRGYGAANINTISTCAGFAKGTVYNYYPSKLELFRSVLSLRAADHVRALRSAALSTSDPEERLRRFFREGFAYIEREPLAARLLLRSLQEADQGIQAYLGGLYRPLFALLSDEVLRPGMAGGAFEAGDPDRTAVLIMTLYLGTGSQTDASGAPYLDPGTVSEFALRAIKRSGAGAGKGRQR